MARKHSRRSKREDRIMEKALAQEQQASGQGDIGTLRETARGTAYFENGQARTEPQAKAAAPGTADAVRTEALANGDGAYEADRKSRLLKEVYEENTADQENRPRFGWGPGAEYEAMGEENAPAAADAPAEAKERRAGFVEIQDLDEEPDAPVQPEPGTAAGCPPEAHAPEASGPDRSVPETPVPDAPASEAGHDDLYTKIPSDDEPAGTETDIGEDYGTGSAAPAEKTELAPTFSLEDISDTPLRAFMILSEGFVKVQAALIQNHEELSRLQAEIDQKREETKQLTAEYGRMAREFESYLTEFKTFW